MLTKLVRCFLHFSHFEWGDWKNPGILRLQNTGCNSQIPAHFTRVAAQERENWLALLQEQGQFGQNQFSQFSELTRSIYARSEPTGQFWQMVSALKYSHAITHDATILKDPGPRPVALVPQKYWILG